MTLATVSAVASPRYPDANVLVDGFATPIARIPENEQNVRDREKVYFETLCPQNFFHAWIAEDVALMTLRLERCARIERRERDRIALRAEHFWDDDRRREVEEVGARLSDNPARTVARLRTSPHGCDWMIGRWLLLAREIEQGRTWTEAQATLAHDLLGTHPDFRIDAPGLPLDPASLAQREIAALRDHRSSVAEADVLDRSLAMADLSDERPRPSCVDSAAMNPPSTSDCGGISTNSRSSPSIATPTPNSPSSTPPRPPRPRPSRNPNPSPSPSPNALTLTANRDRPAAPNRDCSRNGPAARRNGAAPIASTPDLAPVATPTPAARPRSRDRAGSPASAPRHWPAFWQLGAHGLAFPGVISPRTALDFDDRRATATHPTAARPA